MNPATLRSVDSARDFTLQWQTEWMRPADTLNISLIAQRYPQQPDVIACAARALDGTLTIGAALLKQLRPLAGQLTLLSVGYSRLPEVTSLRRRDADPMPAILNWSSFTTIPVTLR